MYTITVTSLADVGTGTLREAIELANAYTGTDEIQILIDESLAGQSIHNDFDLPKISKSCRIIGNGISLDNLSHGLIVTAEVEIGDMSSFFIILEGHGSVQASEVTLAASSAIVLQNWSGLFDATGFITSNTSFMGYYQEPCVDLSGSIDGTLSKLPECFSGGYQSRSSIRVKSNKKLVVSDGVNLQIKDGHTLYVEFGSTLDVVSTTGTTVILGWLCNIEEYGTFSMNGGVLDLAHLYVQSKGKVILDGVDVRNDYNTVGTDSSLLITNNTFHNHIYLSGYHKINGSGNIFLDDLVYRLTGYSGDTSVLISTIGSTESSIAHIGVESLVNCTLAALPSELLPGGYKTLNPKTEIIGYTKFEDGATLGISDSHALEVSGILEAKNDVSGNAILGSVNSLGVNVKNGGKLQLKNADIRGVEKVVVNDGGRLEMSGGMFDTRDCLDIQSGAYAELVGVEVNDVVCNYGTLNVSNCVIHSYVLLANDSELIGNGNVFVGEEVYRLDNFTGSTAAILTKLKSMDSTYLHENAYISIVPNSRNIFLGNLLLDVMPEMFPGGYKMKIKGQREIGREEYLTVAAGGKLTFLNESDQYGNHSTLYVSGLFSAGGENKNVTTEINSGYASVYVMGGRVELMNVRYQAPTYIRKYQERGGEFLMIGGWLTRELIVTDDSLAEFRDVEIISYIGVRYYGTLKLSGCQSPRIADLAAAHAEFNIGEASQFVAEDCIFVGNRMTFDSSATVRISGSDLSDTIITINGIPEDDSLIDLSGNYWGTTNMDEIWEKISGDKSRVVIDGIMLTPPPRYFTLANQSTEWLKIADSAGQLTLKFNREIDANSVSSETLGLCRDDGSVVSIQEYIVEGKSVTLVFDTLPVGQYSLKVTNGLKDTSGNTYSMPSEFENGITYEVYDSSAHTPPRLLLVRPNSTLTDQFSSVDLFFNQTLDAGSITIDKVHVYAASGEEMSINRFYKTVVSGKTCYRLEFDAATETGTYAVTVDASVRNEYGVEMAAPFEQNIYVASPDLQLADEISFTSATPGRYATITYTVENRGDGAAVGSWTDCVYLCRSEAWDESEAILFGRVTRSKENLASGATYSASVSGILPGLGDERYYVFVRTDEASRVSESNEQNNDRRASDPMELIVPELSVGVSLDDATTSANELLYYCYTAEVSGTLAFALKNADGKICVWEAEGDASVSIGRVVKSENEQTLYFSAEAGQKYYISVKPNRTGQFAMELRETSFALVSVSVNSVSAGHTTTMSLVGTELSEGMNVYLEDAQGNRYDATNVVVKNPVEATVQFELPEEVNPGTSLKLVAEDLAGNRVLLPENIKVVEYSNAVYMEFYNGMNQWSGAAYSRAGYVWKTDLNVVNVANYDVENAIILVTDTAPDFAMYYSYDDAKVRDRSALMFLGGAGDSSPNQLLAGEKDRLDIFVKNYRSSEGRIEAHVFDPTDTTAIAPGMWEQIASALRPATCDDETWAAWWSNMQPRIGTTVADFVSFVRDMQQVSGKNTDSSLADLVDDIMQNHADYVPSYAIRGVLKYTNGEVAAEGEGVTLYEVQGEDWIQIATATVDSDGHYVFWRVEEGKTYYVIPDRWEEREKNADGLELFEPLKVNGSDVEYNAVALPPIEEKADYAQLRYWEGNNGEVYRCYVRNGRLVFAEHVDGVWLLTEMDCNQRVLQYRMLQDAEGRVVIVWTEEDGNSYVQLVHDSSVSNVVDIKSFGIESLEGITLVGDSVVYVYGLGASSEFNYGNYEVYRIDTTQDAFWKSTVNAELSYTEQKTAGISITENLTPESIKFKIGKFEVEANVKGSLSRGYETDCKYTWTGSLFFEAESDSGDWETEVTGEASFRYSLAVEQKTGDLSNDIKLVLPKLSISVQHDTAFKYVLGATLGALAGVGTVAFGGLLAAKAARIVYDGTVRFCDSLVAFFDTIGIELELGVKFGAEGSYTIPIGGQESGVLEWSLMLASVFDFEPNDKKSAAKWMDKFKIEAEAEIGVKWNFNGKTYEGVEGFGGGTIKLNYKKDKEIEINIGYDKEEGWYAKVTVDNYEYGVNTSGYTGATGDISRMREDCSLVQQGEIVTFVIEDDEAGSKMLYYVNDVQTGEVIADPIYVDFTNMEQFGITGNSESGLYMESLEGCILDDSGVLFSYEYSSETLIDNGSYSLEDVTELLENAEERDALGSLLYKDGVVYHLDVHHIAAATTGVISSALISEAGINLMAWIRRIDEQYEIYTSSLDLNQGIWQKPDMIYQTTDEISNVTLHFVEDKFVCSFETGIIVPETGQTEMLLNSMELAGDRWSAVSSLNETLENEYQAAFKQERTSGAIENVVEDLKNKLIADFAFPTFPNCKDKKEEGPDAELPHRNFQSYDPNDIYGPEGYGAQNWIGQQEMMFEVVCENIPEENIAHAAMVTIKQQIDAAYDYSTFRLGDMMIAGNYIQVDGDVQSYKARHDWTSTLGVWMDVNAVFDADTGLMTWEFVAIDPETGYVVADPFTGLLAPNYNPPEGDGGVKYYVTPKETTASGTVMQSQAEIIFDFNEPIDTPLLKYTLDGDNPVATVQSVTESGKAEYLLVRWGGTDVGSGVKSYDVYVSVDGGEWLLWQDNISFDSALYAKLDGEHTYAFYAQATDYAGNAEAVTELVAPEATLGATRSDAESALSVESVQSVRAGDELTLSIAFSEQAVCADWAAALQVSTDALDIDLSVGTFSYDETPHVLTWVGTVAGVPDGAQATVRLKDGAVTDAAGLPFGSSAPAYTAPVELPGVVGSTYAAPALVDYNGDGLLDVLVGEVAENGKGRIRIYLNEGSAEVASFASFIYAATAEDTPIELAATGCQGAIVRFADITGDGKDEMVVGLADGTIRIFTAAEGGYWADVGELTCAVGGESETVDVGTRAAIEFVDANGDGRTDMLVGTGDGNVLLYLNTSAEGAAAFDAGRYLHDAAGRIKVGNRASVSAGDVDGDGLWDMLLGTADGNILFYRNEGTTGTPLFGAAETVFAGDALLDMSSETNRVRIDTGDLNGDGIDDLVVGQSDGKVKLLYGTDGADLIGEVVVGSIPLPGVPQNVQMMVDGSALTISWDAVAADEAAVISYEVSYLAAGAEEPTVVAVSGTETTLELPDGVYSVQVRALNHGKGGDWSTAQNVTVDTVAPEVPGGVSAEGGETQAVLSWVAVAEAASYELRYRKSGSEVWRTVSGTEASVTLESLDPAEYVWQVRAVDAAGNASEWSASSTFTVTGVLPDAEQHWANGLRFDASGAVTGGYFDVNKIGSGDSNLCWAAAASNMLAWWQEQGMTTTVVPDAPQGAETIYATFTQSWENSSGVDVYGLIWWLSGDSTSSGYDDYVDAHYRGDSATGAYYEQFYTPQTIAQHTAQVQLAEVEADTLSSAWVDIYEASGMIALGVFRSVGSGGSLSGGHSLTLWGFETNLDTGRVQEIYVTDSDDNTTALETLAVEYDEQTGYYTVAQDGARLNGYVLGTYTYLKSFTGTDIVSPEVTAEAPVTEKLANGRIRVTFRWSCSEAAACVLTVDGQTYNVGSETSYTLELADGEHAYSITATDAAGNSGSATGSFAMDATAPAVVQGVQAITGESGVAVSWDAVEDAASYTLEYATKADFSDAKKVTGITGTEYALTDMPGTGMLYVRVTAADTAGNVSDWSAVAQTGLDITAPVVTLNEPELKKIADGRIAVTFSWSCSEPAVYTLTVDGEEYSVRGATHYTLELADGEHAYSITATDAAGNSGSATGSFAMDATPPAVVQGVQAITGESGVAVSWNVVEDAASYTLEYATKPDFSDAQSVTGITGTSYALTALPGTGTLYVRVASADAAGNVSAWSAVAESALDITAPGAVQGLEVMAHGTSARLSWDAVSDASGIAGYRIEYAVDGDFTKAQSMQVNSTEATFYTLLAGVAYQWRVAAVDGAGNVGEWSVGEAFRTGAAEPEDDSTAESREIIMTVPSGGESHSTTRVNGWVGFDDPADYYCFTAKGEGAYAISLDAAVLGTQVYLSVGILDDKGNFAAEKKLLVAPGSAAAALGGIALESGEKCYIRVESYDKGLGRYNGEYSLSVDAEVADSAWVTDDNSPDKATMLKPGGAVDAALSGWVGMGDAVDYYCFELTKPAELSLVLGELDAAVKVKLLREERDGGVSQVMSRSVKAGRGLDHTLSLTSGTYFVEVASYDNGAGRYNTTYALELQKEEANGETKRFSLANA